MIDLCFVNVIGCAVLVSPRFNHVCFLSDLASWLTYLIGLPYLCCFPPLARYYCSCTAVARPRCHRWASYRK